MSGTQVMKFKVGDVIKFLTTGMNHKILHRSDSHYTLSMPEEYLHTMGSYFYSFVENEFELVKPKSKFYLDI